jgi:hypothetical protein
MKKLVIFLLATLALSNVALADEYINGYYREDGTYVQPHYQTAPDNNLYNNYSTQGNLNPYTGQAGTVNPNQLNTAPYYGVKPVAIGQPQSHWKTGLER